MAHDRKDVRADRSLKTMYIEPIVRIFRENGGRMWKGSDDRLDLVIDQKTAESMPGVVATGPENRSVSGVRRTPGAFESELTVSRSSLVCLNNCIYLCEKDIYGNGDKETD